MGTPNYPPNMGDEWNKLKRDVKGAFTSANLRVGMAKIGAKVVEVSGRLNITNGRMEVFDGSGISKVKLGLLDDGSYGLEAVDPKMVLSNGSISAENPFGQTIVQMGRLEDGDFGLAVLNQANELVKLSDFVFGPTQQIADAQFVTSSTSYVGNVNGPAVTVNVPSTGRVMVIVSARIGWSGSGGEHGGAMNIELDGANTIAPTSGNSPGVNRYENIGGATFHNSFAMASRTRFIEGLNPGPTNFSARYCSLVSGQSADFQNRVLAVFPY
ncbi:hypothetical protein FHG89_31635 [Micromonospora orduensis]|uniref:Uncharacterized protein n=1 Tax=Micromonospora orduensis TaxID=1420891 RepID=A0A5C4QCI0_9ACTN|nr:hypothetical protein [Micromonospora orduensis]TNH21442.1 hypothetical protein FHG89_31635 [Micromonospora orduensis]